MKRWIHASTESIDSKEMRPYKGYRIEKSWKVDHKGRPIPDSETYMVIDEEDDWIGDVYKTLKEAHQYIDDFVSGKVDSLA